MRLFVAIDLPDPVRQAVSALPRRVSGARWVPDAQLHLTLCFIGSVADERLGPIADSLAGVGGKPFSLRVTGAGTFPPGGRDPRVLWLGLERVEALLELQRRIEAALSAVEVPREARAFHPHVTLARLKSPRRDQVARALAELGALALEPFAVDAFVLYSSRVDSDGATHSVERRYPL